LVAGITAGATLVSLLMPSHIDVGADANDANGANEYFATQLHSQRDYYACEVKLQLPLAN